MKNHILITCFVVLTLFACTPYSYFNTPNDLQDKNCEVHLLNGNILNGNLTVQLETGRSVNKTLSIKTGNASETISIDSVAYYIYNSEYYYPKEVNLNDYTIPLNYNLDLPNQYNKLFIKRLTNENSKVHLYELYQSKNQSPDGSDHYYYFVSLPTESRLTVWAIGSNKFLPNFDKKMSAIVADCPGLANKIKEKEDGYSLSQLTLELKKLKIYKRIIEEYNNCK